MYRINTDSIRGTTKDASNLFTVKTEVTLRMNGEVVLTASVDETGAFLSIPKENVSLPTEVLRTVLERAGITYPPMLGVGTVSGNYAR